MGQPAYLAGSERARWPNAGDWSFEGGAIALVRRNGWTRTDLKPGDRVTVTTHPQRNGSRVGSMLTVLFPSGATKAGGGVVPVKTNPDLIER